MIEQLGNIRVRQKRYADAVPLLQKAASAPDAPPEVHFNLGLALDNIGRKDEALSSYSRFLQLVPDDPQGNLAAGLLLKEKGDKQEAVNHLAKAFNANQSDRALAEEIGNLYLDLGKEDEARKYLAQATQTRPSISPTWALRQSANSNIRRPKVISAQRLRKIHEMPRFGHTWATFWQHRRRTRKRCRLTRRRTS